MTDKEALWAALVAHEKPPFIPNFGDAVDFKQTLHHVVNFPVRSSPVILLRFGHRHLNILAVHLGQHDDSHGDEADQAQDEQADRDGKAQQLVLQAVSEAAAVRILDFLHQTAGACVYIFKNRTG